LFAFAGEDIPAGPPVLTMVKADLRCSSVAAASVLAKVERDELMVGLAQAHPAYGWAGNKGYAAPEHLAALAAYGPCVLHRRSWRLPGVPAAPTAGAGDLAGVVERTESVVQTDRRECTG
jgi:ribonuclease HII